MKYVLDSSSALPRVLPEKDSAKAILLRDGARNAVHELLTSLQSQFAFIVALSSL